MELYQVRSFLEIVATRNLTRAAEQLNISQSALSSQIRLLEEELGVQLFARSARGMELTGQGRILHSYAEDVIRAAQDMQAKAEEISGRNFGTCRIGLNTDGAFLQVSRLSRALAAVLPDVNVVFVSSQTIRTPEMLRQGLIDVGFFFGDCQDSGIETVFVSNFRIAIVVPDSILPRGSELDWHKAAALPWIWSVCDCPYYQIVQDKFDGHGLLQKKVVDAMDESVVRELVLDGQGLAIMREDEALAVAGSGTAWVWDDVRFTLPLRLGWLKQAGENGTLQTVKNTILLLWQNGGSASRDEFRIG
ncbi:LysR family transcriptional regulator [Desulfopila aestuarii]|uniref:DNA-binding transcriptional regulator, LysR family n=1 Tax=Desulfopila aestuarii DSM 18488 TaxID=1121416 RepID=A0A1M7YIT9_9BACT|nr:LysR family transcriptional regulator [Desulfopila aestuarii]SHO52533.1 DNA-binding transcriptional regulator, LysR family [Desulfopila aestuarii DSM 18488]